MRRWIGGEEISGQRGRKLANLELDVKTGRWRSLRWRRGKGGAGRLSQIRWVSLCSSLHSILGRSCFSRAGYWNLGNRLNKSRWVNLLLVLVWSTTPSSRLFRGGRSSCLAGRPSSLLIWCQVFLFWFSLHFLFISCLAFNLKSSPSVPFISLSFQSWLSSSVSSPCPSHLYTTLSSLSVYFSSSSHKTCADNPASLSVCRFFF